MDNIYENLENFNEEDTIAKLQIENKELKSKLEEYASTLEKLRQDFDKLSSEYKKLELNYSSLLKTAKVEIERKTQIISNLNLEKDKMVLMSFQNSKNKAYCERPMLAHNYMNNRDIKSQRHSKIKEIEQSRKPSPQTATERKQDFSSKDATPSSHVDIGIKLLNMANSSSRQDLRTKPPDCKENKTQPKQENYTLKDLVKNRRKSIQTVSLEVEKISTDDNELASTGCSKEHSRGNKDRDLVRNFSDRHRSRISGNSSLEDKSSGCNETSPDAHQSRNSRYDSNKIDKYRVRDKSTHRYKQLSPDRHKKLSPDRYKKRSTNCHDNSYRRFEYDKHRAKGRVLESPPKEKYHWRPNREQLRDVHEKSHPHEYEKLPLHSQGRYPMKHKIQHKCDELESKRMKLESHYKQQEVDRRLQNERGFSENKYSTEPFEIQFSSCESPDYYHPDVSTHQIKEIKLTATTHLDDPRISTKKYVLEKNNGKTALSIAEGRNVDIIPISKISWGIKHVSMPEALAQWSSPEIEQADKAINPEFKNSVVNISMESGEICDSENLDSHNLPKDKTVNESNIPIIGDKVLPITKFNNNGTRDIENSLQKINTYKIPKLKKNVDDKQTCKRSKEITPVLNPIQENKKKTAVLTPIPENKKSKSSDTSYKNIDESKYMQIAKEKLLAEENKQARFITQSNNELPNLGNDDACDQQQYISAKGVIEGDLEMSDDNCDNNEQSSNIVKENVCTQVVKQVKHRSQTCNNTTEVHSADKLEKVSSESSKNKTIDDYKKLKSKKKLKPKETKEDGKTKDPAQVFNKPTRKKEKENETIKNKFSELFDDSSSLISPEDLGLSTAPAFTGRLPDKCVPFFEDALDATDLNAIKKARDSIPSEEPQNETSKLSGDITDKANTINEVVGLQPIMSEEVIKSIYSNLEPGVPDKESDEVKTVIISTGVQPQVAVELEEQELVSKIEPKNRIADHALKALATSTPHKMWQSDVANVEEKLPACSNTNDSRMESVDNTTPLDNSDANTDSLLNGTDVPDVRIFVRRRRKVNKKC